MRRGQSGRMPGGCVAGALDKAAVASRRLPFDAESVWLGLASEFLKSEREVLVGVVEGDARTGKCMGYPFGAVEGFRR